MQKNIFFLVVTAIVLLTNCNENNPSSPLYNPPPVKWSDYFPLKVSSYWIYEVYGTDSNYIRLNNTPSYDTIMVDKIMTVQGKKCFKLLRNPNSRFSYDKYFYGVGSKLFEFIKSNYDTFGGVWLLHTDYSIRIDSSQVIYTWHSEESSNDNSYYLQLTNTIFKNTDTVMTIMNKKHNLLGLIEILNKVMYGTWGLQINNTYREYSYYIKNIGLGYVRNEYIDQTLSGINSKHSYSERILIKYYNP